MAVEGWTVKFGNQPCTNAQGESFQSKLEMRRWQELTILQKAGEISELERQVTYRLDVNGYHIANTSSRYNRST